MLAHQDGFQDDLYRPGSRYNLPSTRRVYHNSPWSVQVLFLHSFLYTFTWRMIFMNKILRAASYIRVSTSEQALHGYSLQAQKEYLESYALSRDAYCCLFC